VGRWSGAVAAVALRRGWTEQPVASAVVHGGACLRCWGGGGGGGLAGGFSYSKEMQRGALQLFTAPSQNNSTTRI
jgi:hypothetical protein